MKKRFLLFVFCVFVIFSHLQAQIDYASLKTEKKEDFTEEVNKAALQAATAVLSLPLEKDNAKRVEAFTFLMRWMTASPHFNFDIDEIAMKVTRGNDDLLAVYLAAMTRYVLENRDMAGDKKAVKLNTVKSVLAYCQSQQVKLTGELKKMNKANESGELERYLKL
jgi:hypothetical protein